MGASNSTESAIDFTKCGICDDTITDPRGLPCLHTFCLACLQEWASGSQCNGDCIACPTCKKEVDLPKQGVDGFPVNFFVLSLTDRRPKKKQKCVCCEITNDIVSRCFDCDGFLCQKGVEAHLTLAMMKGHHVVSIKELESGKVDVRQFLKPPSCKKHDGQVFWLYCETCHVLICQGCTVLDHCKPAHRFVELGTVVETQKDEIRQLYTECDKSINEIQERIEKIKMTKTMLDVSVTEVSNEIDKAADAYKKHIDKVCDEQKASLRNWGNEASEDIGKSKKTLEDYKLSLQGARAMAKQLVSSGSDHHIASMHSHLKTSYADLCKDKPVINKTEDDYRVKFVPDTEFESKNSTLGTLKLGSSNSKQKRCVLSTGNHNLSVPVQES